ncbi:transcription factor RfeG [Colletotrichum asianum]|uniref:Transcription factor RfeG n=1 Tax=Colletotrichum asianum TaxID=702518 RepID=A0A8H3ZJX7_9PEZI|nr:transcription factor RfeG [Colletotrichum asianum]
MPSSSEMNRYWIPRLDIHKKIITQELPYYLGPDATVRPYTNEGEDGFLITTPGPCLTDVSLVVACPCLAQNCEPLTTLTCHRNKSTISAENPKKCGSDKPRLGLRRPTSLSRDRCTSRWSYPEGRTTRHEGDTMHTAATSGIDVTMIGDVNDVKRFGGAGLK